MSNFEETCNDAIARIKKGIESIKKIQDYLENPRMEDVAFFSLDYPEGRIDGAVFEYDEDNFEWIIHAYPSKPIPPEVFGILRRVKLFPGQYDVNLVGEEGEIQMLMATILVPKENYRTFLRIAKIRYLSRLRKVFKRLSDPEIQKKLLELKKQLDDAERRSDRKTIEKLELMIESLLLE